MKFVLVLAVLLHLCHSVDFNLIEELISRLDRLTNENVTFIKSHHVKVPSTKMQNNARACMGEFTRRLNDLLKNATATTEEGTILLQEVNANIKSLPPAQENATCHMTLRRSDMNPLKPYSTFLKKLNSSL